MKFLLNDAILEQGPDHIIVIKQVSLAEEYLADHFPSFPVLPGVMMIEAMVQAARTMLTSRDPILKNLVLGEVKNLKFGNMVRPGESLHIQISLEKQIEDGSYVCKGIGTVARHAKADYEGNETAVSGKFTMRPVRTR